MSSLRSSLGRLVLISAVGLLALLEGQALVRTLREASRQREALAARVRPILRAARVRCVQEVRLHGPMACALLLQRMLPSEWSAEVELFDRHGTRLAAVPSRAPVEHWPGVAERRALESDEVVVVGPVPGHEPRLLSYAALEDNVVRVASAAPAFLAELRLRRELAVSHAVTLGVLFLFSLLLLRPAPRLHATPSPSAYEEAVLRLRHSGREQERRHQEELKRMEETARDLEAMARAGEITAGMVHEVRNGLATVLGYTRLIEDDPRQAAEAATHIREECQALEGIVRRFVEFARQEKLHIEGLDVMRLLERVVARELRAGSETTIELEPARLVAGFQGDEELLERAFENLVRNAREAAGPSGTVTLRVWEDTSGLTVSIEDDGPGLPEETRSKLRPFFSTKTGGLGLGLALATKITRLHGGELTLEAATPRGVRARMTLPFDAAPLQRA